MSILTFHYQFDYVTYNTIYYDNSENSTIYYDNSEILTKINLFNGTFYIKDCDLMESIL